MKTQGQVIIAIIKKINVVEIVVGESDIVVEKRVIREQVRNKMEKNRQNNIQDSLIKTT